MKIHTLTAPVLLILAACSRDSSAARHTVQDYRADKALRQEVFKKCGNDPGTLGAMPDCVNAQEAERLESYGSLRNSGAVGLDAKKQH